MASDSSSNKGLNWNQLPQASGGIILRKDLLLNRWTTLLTATKSRGINMQ